MKTKIKKGMMLTTAFVIAALVCAEARTSSGFSDIDALRIEVKAEATDGETVESRRSAMHRWWRLMWRSGQDMSRFDEVAVTLLQTAEDSAANYAAVDRGYAVLEEMLKNPEYIEEKRGEQATEGTQATDWPFYGGAALKNNGYSPDAGPSEGRIAWRFPKGYRWDVVPVVEDGNVYLTSPGIDVVGFCLEEETGKVVWRSRQYGERFYGTPKPRHNPVVSADRVLIRSGSKLLSFDKKTGRAIEETGGSPPAGKVKFAYEKNDNWMIVGDSLTGRTIWQREFPSMLSGEPQMDGDDIYVSLEAGEVLKFTSKASKPVWQTDLGDKIRGKVSVGRTALYAGGSGTILTAIDKRDGTVKWSYNSGKSEKRANQELSSVLEAGNRLYFGTASCEVHCVDARTGKLIWKHQVGDWVRARPVKKGNTVYIATLDSRLYALEDSGSAVREKWVQSLGSHGITADLVAGSSHLLASGRDLLMYAVDYETGEIRWRHGILDGAWVDGNFIKADYTSGLPGSPTVVDGILYVGGPDGFVNALDVETGREIWKFEAGATVTGAVSIIDGKAVFGRISSAFDIPRKEEAPPLFAVDCKTGEPIWTSREFGNIWIGAIQNDKVMFVGDMSGYVYGVDPDTGKKLWQYYTAKDTPQEDKPHDHHKHGWPPGVYCMPVADGDCFYTGSWSGFYFAWEQESGHLRWRTQTGYPETGGGLPDSAAPTLHKDHLYVQKQGFIIAAINIHSGEIDWEWKASPGYLQNGTLAALGDKVYASTARRVTHIPFISWIHCFKDVENGSELLWSHRGGGGLTAPVVTDDQLIFGSSTGMFIKSIDPQTGDLNWRVFTGGEMTENVPAIYGDMVFAVSKNGWLNAIR